MKKGCLFIFILMIIVAVLAGAAFYMLGSSNNVDVEISDDAYQSAVTKTGVNFDSINTLNLINLANNDFKTTGTIQVDESFTENELSSVISRANEGNGPIRDIRIKLLDDNKGELSFSISDELAGYLNDLDLNLQLPFSALTGSSAYLAQTIPVGKYLSSLVNGKSIYAKGRLERTSPNSVDISIEAISVGKIPLPRATIDTIEYEVIKFVNTIISKENGFNIEELRVDEGKLYYKGTLPAEVEGISMD